jgi:hypothetical protein
MSTRDTTIEDSTLETESFVHFVHNRCAQMAPLSVADVEDLYSIRTAPECQLDRVTKEEVAQERQRRPLAIAWCRQLGPKCALIGPCRERRR